MNIVWLILLFLVVVFATLLYVFNRSRQLHIWFVSYLKQLLETKLRSNREGPTHILFSITDHYEPYQHNYSRFSNPMEIVEYWHNKAPVIFDRHSDCNGRKPQYSFFYPAEAYDKLVVEHVAQMCHAGYGEMDVHLHHDNDTAENMSEVLTNFVETLHKDHGMLRKDESGRLIFGFIHGDWALDNSGKNGSCCGINDELLVLKKLGCYADFTLPSAPSETQTSKINSIYYATDDPERPKSHNKGVDVEVGVAPSGDLMIIQGPLTLNWRNRKLGIFPRIENGELSRDSRPSKERVDLWVNQHIHVKGRDDVIFIKVHAHGASEQNLKMMLDDNGLDDLYTLLEEHYNDGDNFKLHYVSAYEMYKVIKEIEAGFSGDPAEVYCAH